MIFGFGLIAIGYSIFYWGLHHFQNVDCDTPNGCRYSLVDLLGIPSGTIPKGTQGGVQLSPPDNSTQTQTPNNAQTGNGFSGSNSTWAGGILSGINAQCTGNNMAKMIAWNACEGNLAGHSGLGINNPFNITADSYQQATHGTGAVNSAGVQNFSTITAGVAGTVAKLNEPFASAIKSNLVNDGSFKAFASAVGSSGWGTSGTCIAGQPSTAQPCNAAQVPGAAGGVSSGSSQNQSVLCKICCATNIGQVLGIGCPGCNC